MVEAAYSDLFSLHSKDAWTLPTGKLISYFRNSDHTSAVVGQRQAGTFQTLAGLCGYGEVPSPKAVTPVRRAEKKEVPAQPKAAPRPARDDTPPVRPAVGRDVGLTVRIEINLPAAADQETYDRIFKSIRENLIGVE
jgi:hypothetical protein